MRINAKWVRDNWLFLTLLAGAVAGGMKFKWNAELVATRVTILETKVAGLEADNLIRKGAAEVWKARGLYGPAPKPNDH